ncbi:GAD-like domain-containing protein [Pseudomonas sp.]|uniref:GAD-like domain-containing protein n=1 Tax=Pseudomonas sp. TaxID=306 RepID=UPI001B156916|nr:GAD-like domain-containing protein [Pseudomonas sp.]MBO9551114.1 DUF1851 domain-containing protein [Pseudomonas sp.]
MDRLFARLAEKIGPPTCRQIVPNTSIERYKGKLPHQLLEHWSQYGWSGFGKGIFWLVNPKEYECVVDAWLDDTEHSKHDKYHLIARSAFGDMYFWGEKTGASLKITSILSSFVTRTSIYSGEDLDKGFPAFLLSISLDSNDYGDMFEPAYAKLGALAADEMYGFTPAIMLGGPGSLNQLEKVKSVEHLSFLAQLSDLRPYI